MRVMGLDIGSKTIGVALSDPFGLIAQTYKTIWRTTLDEDLDELLQIIEEKDVGLIVAGEPRHMNNDRGRSVQIAKNLAARLRDKSGLDLIYQDERLTTVSAERILIESKVRRENRKAHIDKIAASIILQTYLDRRNNG